MFGLVEIFEIVVFWFGVVLVYLIFVIIVVDLFQVLWCDCLVLVVVEFCVGIVGWCEGVGVMCDVLYLIKVGDDSGFVGSILW